MKDNKKRRLKNVSLPGNREGAAFTWRKLMPSYRRYQFSILHFSLFILLFLLTGCRKDLCYNHDEHSLSVKVDAKVTWEQEWERTYDYNWEELWQDHWALDYDELRPDIAEGVRVVAYDTDTDGKPVSETNLSANGGRILALPEGTHDLLLYNNDTEYIVFNDLHAVTRATATTRTMTRGNFSALHAEERTVNQPDILYGHFEEEHWAERTLQPMTLEVTLRPLVYTYLVRYKFSHGLQYVALARGALAGMAESVYLNDGHTGDDAATVMFDCSLTDYGAETRLRSFGVPNYPGHHYTRADGSPATYHLNLEVRLKNGKYKTFEFDVTDQVEGQPRGGIITVTGIEVTDEEGSGGGGGFDVDVDGWGDYIDIPLPLS